MGRKKYLIDSWFPQMPSLNLLIKIHQHYQRHSNNFLKKIHLPKFAKSAFTIAFRMQVRPFHGSVENHQLTKKNPPLPKKHQKPIHSLTKQKKNHSLVKPKSTSKLLYNPAICSFPLKQSAHKVHIPERMNLSQYEFSLYLNAQKQRKQTLTALDLKRVNHLIRNEQYDSDYARVFQ